MRDEPPEPLNNRPASSGQLWRLNELGLLDLRDEPGRPLERGELKETIAETVKRGMWTPQPHGRRGPVRSG
jgi:hypothetical protein